MVKAMSEDNPMLLIGLMLVAVLITSGCLSDESRNDIDDIIYGKCKKENVPYCISDFCQDEDIVAIDGNYNFTLEQCVDKCIDMICKEYAYGRE